MGKYNVHSAYRVIQRNSVEQQNVEIFESLWKIDIPLRVSFLLWRLFLDKLSTKANMKKKHVLLDSND